MGSEMCIRDSCTAVCSDIAAFKDLLGDSGVYFKNNNLEDLKQTVEQLDSDEIQTIYNKQKTHIEKYYVDKVMSSWISLYTQI